MTPALPGLALGACVVLAAVGMALLRADPLAARLASDAVRSTRRGQPLLWRAFEFLSVRLATPAIGLLGRRRLDRARRRLEVAGRPMTLEAYAGRKACFALGFGALGLIFLLQRRPFAAVMVTAMAVGWVDLWLAAVTRRRRERVNRDLPDFLDVLAVTVSAGVAFRTALARVADADGGPLGEEVRVCLRQMELGMSRRAALDALRSRSDSEALGQMVTALLQAEELGAPLAETLIDLAVDMRRAAAQDARRRAARAAPRITLVVTLIIVPAAMILIGVGLFVSSGVDFGDLTNG